MVKLEVYEICALMKPEIFTRVRISSKSTHCRRYIANFEPPLNVIFVRICGALTVTKESGKEEKKLSFKFYDERRCNSRTPRIANVRTRGKRNIYHQKRQRRCGTAGK